MSTPLTPEERARDLPALADTGWQAVPGRDAIRKVWRFDGFGAAWGFMSRVALLAERLDHHPEWANTYDVVDVTLATHDCDGLSALDIRMARAMDRLTPGIPTVAQDGAPILSLCQIRQAGRA